MNKKYLLFLSLGVIAVSVIIASGLLLGWWDRDVTIIDQESGEIIEDLDPAEMLEPYQDENVVEQMSKDVEKLTLVEPAIVLMTIGDVSSQTGGERSDTSAIQDLATAKENVHKVLGATEAVYYIRDNFYPLSELGDNAFYSPLVDLSFLFDEHNYFYALCQGQVSQLSDGFCQIGPQD